MDCEKALFYGGSQKGVRMLLSQVVLDQVLQGYHLCYQTVILQSDSHLYLYSHKNRQLHGLDGERSGEKFTHAGSCRMFGWIGFGAWLGRRVPYLFDA